MHIVCLYNILTLSNDEYIKVISLINLFKFEVPYSSQKNGITTRGKQRTYTKKIYHQNHFY